MGDVGRGEGNSSLSLFSLCFNSGNPGIERGAMSHLP